jgi:hypothetical protein
VTAEHTLPGWLAQHVAGRLRVRRTGTDHPEMVWRERGLRHRIRVVCANCNNGWMSEVEQEAKPYLVPLLDRTPNVLPPEAQAAIATWAFKTSCVMATTRHPNLVSDRDIVYLFQHRKPPDDVEILVGSYKGQSQLWIDHRGLRFDHSGASDYPLGDAYMTVIQIRALLIVVFCDVTGLGRSIADATPFSLMSIWPLGQEQRWPPRLAYTDQRLETLMGQASPSGLGDRKRSNKTSRSDDPPPGAM